MMSQRGDENIFLFIPNIIGYIRICLTVLGCYWMFTDPLKAAFCFSLSHTVLDDLDGIAARRLKQATRFGGVFDIAIDRFSFMMWLMGLCVLYPEYTFLFQLFGLLDIMRILMKVYGGAINKDKNHKTGGNHWIIDFYYTELGQHIFSFGSELYFVALQLCYFSPGLTVPFIGYGVWQILAALLFPLVIIKVPINLLLLKRDSLAIAKIDLSERKM